MQIMSLSLPLQAGVFKRENTAVMQQQQPDSVHFGARAKKEKAPKTPASPLFINGALVQAAGKKTLPVLNPVDQTVIGKVPVANTEDVNAAVSAAREAFKSWRKTTPQERAIVLRNIANTIKNNADELARLETLNNGKPLEESKMDVADTARHFEFFADKALLNTDVAVAMPDGAAGVIKKIPLGVAGQIIPWNYPLMMAAWKLAPALAAGCTTVIKSAEQTPLSLIKLAELLQKDNAVPKGVINVLSGGASTGKALLAHPGVDIYSFTGSGQVGKLVAQAAALHPNYPKPVILELGGKSPNIVFEDADIDNAVKGTMFGIMINQGEVCSAGSRILVHRSVYNEFVNKMAEMTKNITLGNGNAPGVKMGPLVSAGHTERVLYFIEQAKKEGARLVTGGGRATEGDLAKGNFVLPTIFADVHPNSTLAQQEVFGPVAAIIPFDTEAEAVELANGTLYGLAAAIWTKDDAKADRVEKQVDAGVVWINASQPAYAEIPWGGVKGSGYGKDKIESYQSDKTVYKAASAVGPFIDWYPNPEQK